MKLSHEIEYFNQSTGVLVAWVNVSMVSSSVDTVLYLYYGNLLCSSQQNPSGVWDSHYMMVHHLEELTGNISDSTNNSNNGIPQNGTTLNAPGKIDGADRFDGTNDYESIADNPTLDGGGTRAEMTIETWLKSGVDHQAATITVAKRHTSSDGSYQLGFDSQGNSQLFAGFYLGSTYAETSYMNSPVLTTGRWYQVVCTYKNGEGIKLYINGILTATNPSASGLIHDTTIPLYLGARDNNAPERFFHGDLDEVRLSNIARSNNWILLSYRNQNETSTFLSVGPEERQGIHITSLTGQWNFISVPYNQTIDKTGLTIVSSGTEHTWTNATTAGIILGFCYEWNRDTQSYQLSDSLKPSQGYWVYAFSACELWLRNVTVRDSDTYITALSTQWNVVGVPDEESVSEGNLMIQYNGTDYNWSQATTSSNPTGGPLILGFIYNWTRSSQAYVLSNTLVPGYAYWIYTYYNCNLKRNS